MKKLILLVMCLLMALALVSCDALKGERGEQGPKGDTPTISISEDGYWVINGEKTNVKAEPDSSSDSVNPQGLAFYPKDDGTYAVAVGQARYLSRIVIPETYCGKPVTEIIAYGFSGTLTAESLPLQEITIPDSVTSIGEGAFNYCIDLQVVYISDLVSWCNIDFCSTDSNPLSNGGNLYLDGELVTDLVIPKGVESIKDNAFVGCGLTSATIPDSVTSIGDYAFRDCSGLTSVTIGEGVTSIGEYAFYDCSSLASVTIGDSVTSIGEYAFRGCFSLASVTIPDSVTSIDYSAFADCSGLAAVYISNRASWCNIDFYSYYSNPLYYAKNLYLDGELVTDLVIPEGVESIKDYAFVGCGFTSVTIGNGVTSIGSYAFYDCSGLTSVTIGESVTSIGSESFYGCSGLTSVTIPDSVTSIGYSAFASCDSLESITIPFVGATLDGEGNTNFGYIFGAWDFSVNENRVPSSLKTVIITGGASISDYAFYYCTSLTSVTIGNGVTSIGERAFYNCTGLTAVYISDIASWCNIGFHDNYSNPLYYAENLYLDGELVTDLVIPDSVTGIGNYAFWNCSGLASVTIGEGVTSIGDMAFYYCSSLRTVYYKGTAEEWSGINIYYRGNDDLTYSADRYYYSETEPTTEGNFWHYVDGVVTKW